MKKNNAKIIFCIFGALFYLTSFLYADTRSEAHGISHYIMGLVQDWDDDPAAAVKEFEEAAKADNANYAVHLRLGADYARRGDYAKAIPELRLAGQLNPQDVESHYLLALIYSTQEKDVDKAADEYEIILKRFSKVDPQNIDVYGYLGQLYYSQKKFDKAIEEFEAILTIDANNAEAFSSLGSICLERKERQKAMDYFKKALNANPDHDSSLNSLGYMYAEDGVHLDEAMTMVQKAVQISPENGAYLDSLGWVYYKKGMNKEALEFLSKAINVSKDPVIYEHLGEVYYKMNQLANAEKSWEESLKLHPGQEDLIKKLDSLKQNASATVK